MNTLVRRFCGVALALFLAGAGTVTLSGCQTVKGVGQDIKNAGEAGERAIDIQP